jgi:hypothetical protein
MRMHQGLNNNSVIMKPVIIILGIHQLLTTSEHVSDGALNALLTSIDYSRIYQLKLLKFVALSVIQYGLLESCSDVFDVYKTMLVKDGDYHITVSLLRHFLQITGCLRATELSAHCCEEFDLTTCAPFLSSFHLLLCLAYKIDHNNNYNCLLESVDQSKLNKSKLDLRDAISAVELFQSMIFKETLHTGDPDSLKQELVAILEGAQLEQELNFVQCYFNQHGMLLI